MCFISGANNDQVNSINHIFSQCMDPSNGGSLWENLTVREDMGGRSKWLSHGAHSSILIKPRTWSYLWGLSSYLLVYQSDPVSSSLCPALPHQEPSKGTWGFLGPTRDWYAPISSWGGPMSQVVLQMGTGLKVGVGISWSKSSRSKYSWKGHPERGGAWSWKVEPWWLPSCCFQTLCLGSCSPGSIRIF